MPYGESFLFDKKDYEFVSNNYWHKASNKPNNPYITSSTHGLLHRYIMKDQLQNGLQVDHINRNPFDNRRSNLRVVTQQENLHNKNIYKTNKSGQPGVKWNPRLKKWQVQITRNKVRKHLGVYESLDEAIEVRKKAE